MNAPTVVHALVARQGFAKPLSGANLLDAIPFIDVFGGAGEKTLRRIGLRLDRAVT